jgi:hypothetical protein
VRWLVALTVLLAGCSVQPRTLTITYTDGTRETFKGVLYHRYIGWTSNYLIRYTDGTETVLYGVERFERTEEHQ